MKAYRENDLILVDSPYNEDFIKAAKDLGGIWLPSKKVWVFHSKVETALLEELRIIYGYMAGDYYELMQVEIPVWYFASEAEVRIGNYLVGVRKSRDEEVDFFGDWEEVSGRLSPTGGSIRNPKIIKTEKDEDIVLRGSLPVATYNRLSEEDKEKVTLIDQAAAQKKALEMEKAELLKRLEEIDAELQNL